MEADMESNQERKALSVGGWIGTLIVMAIPVVNIIMMFVWGFGSGDIGRKRFCIASLILAAIGIVITVAIGLLTGFAMLSFLDYFY
jgi:MFS family permease